MREKNNPPEFRSAVTAAAAAMRCTRYRSARRAAATAGPREVALLAAKLASAIAAAAPTRSVSTPLSFKTTVQSLFGPGGTATKTESL